MTSPYRGIKPPSVFEDAPAPAPVKVPPHLDPAHPDALPAGADAPSDAPTLPPVFSAGEGAPRARGPRDLVVPLRVPIEHEGRAVAEIALRPFTLGDMLAFGTGEVSGLAILEALSGEPQDVLARIEYPDADMLLAALMEHVPQALRRAIEAA